MAKQNLGSDDYNKNNGSFYDNNNSVIHNFDVFAHALSSLIQFNSSLHNTFTEAYSISGPLTFEDHKQHLLLYSVLIRTFIHNTLVSFQ